MGESIKSRFKPSFPKNIKVIPTILFVGVVGKEGFVITVT